MRYTSLFVSLLCASSLLQAQQQSEPATVFVAHFDPVMVIPSCPIGFTAERNSSMELVPIHSGEAKTHQTIRLNLAPRSGPAISEASVTVHGTHNSGLLMPVDDSIDRDISRDFQLERLPGESSLHLATVSSNEISAVHWVDLTFIKYANGTTWHTTETSRCRAHINRLVLVK